MAENNTAEVIVANRNGLQTELAGTYSKFSFSMLSGLPYHLLAGRTVASLHFITADKCERVEIRRFFFRIFPYLIGYNAKKTLQKLKVYD